MTDRQEPSKNYVHGIPAAVSTFVGREAERAELMAALSKARLVTVVGTGGVGKSRLAAETATAAAQSFADGAYWIDLAGVDPSADVVPVVALALGVHEQPALSLFQAVVGSIAHRQMLIVLDNCEHVLASAAPLVQALLEASKESRILSTSREALGVVGEKHVELSPMSLPARESSPEALLATDAGALFMARAMAVTPTFALDADTAPAVARICRLLDGLPLAIELAATRIGVLSVTDIDARLDDRFALLSVGHRSIGGRHRTLAEVIDWSYELLSPPEQALFRRLGVFSGWVDLASVESVCIGGDVGPAALLDVLAGLVSKSLVMARTSSAGPARYRMLMTIRSFAIERLRGTEEAAEIASRHELCFLAIAEDAAVHLTGSRQIEAITVLDTSYDDLRQAMAWSLRRPGAENALRFTAALTVYWRVRFLFSEGLRWLEQALGRSADVDSPARANSLWGWGYLAMMVHDSDRTELGVGQSLDLFRESGDLKGQARALLVLGHCRLDGREPDVGIQLLAESISLARESADHWCLCHALALSGLNRMIVGDISGARSFLDEALVTARGANDLQSLGVTLMLLGQLEVAHGANQRAERLLREGIALCQRLGNAQGAAMCMYWLAEVASSGGDWAEARRCLEMGLAVARGAAYGAQPIVTFALGRLALDLGDTKQARLWFEETRARAGDHWHFSLLGLGELALVEGDTESARRMLDEALKGAQANGHGSLVGPVVRILGAVEQAEGNLREAEAHYRHALELHPQSGERPAMAESLEALGKLAQHVGDSSRAARLLGAAHSLRQSGGFAHRPIAEPSYQAAVEAARAGLGAPAFNEAWQEGQAMSIKDVMAYVTRGRGRRGRRPVTGWESLTPGERDVAALIADGLTNAEIARRRFVSVSAVKKHVGALFAKLGVTSRVDIAKVALAQDQPAPSRI